MIITVLYQIDVVGLVFSPVDITYKSIPIDNMPLILGKQLAGGPSICFFE
jgi:hypothetical protein